MSASELNNIDVNTNVNELWEVFKREHNKSYSDQDEENDRFQIFVETIKTIITHNDKHAKGEVTYKMGINQFSDMRPEERQFGCQKPRS